MGWGDLKPNVYDHQNNLGSIYNNSNQSHEISQLQQWAMLRKKADDAAVAVI